MADKKSDTFTRNDDFWDIGSMLPKRKSRAVFSSDTDAVEVPVTPSASEHRSEKIPPPSSERLQLAREALKKAEQKHHDYMAAAFGDRRKQKTATAKSEKPSAQAPDRQMSATFAATAPRTETSSPADATPSSEPLFSYAPEGNALIQSVTVRLWPSRYSFYERFRADALRFFDAAAHPCEPVPFFSFTPQYSQLSRDQLNYYLFFRFLVRRGEFPKADYAYLLLLIYEIINLPDRLPPEEGLLLLVHLWRAYRKSYPKLDRNLSEWICDYCLIHRLPPPALLYDGTFERALETCSLKEFYVGYDSSSPSPYASALLAYASAYHWRNSKFITDDNRHLFETHIRGAFLYAFDKAEREHQTIFAPLGEKSMTPARTVRDAFNGALCVYSVKRRIEVNYLACSRSVELRYAVTDVIKFAENQVRSLLGIRSRFHTPGLALPLRQAVEEYFAPLKKAQKKEATPTPPPAYEALYEPEHTALSLSLAKDLEERAWATTELLTEDLAKEEPFPSPAEPTPIPTGTPIATSAPSLSESQTPAPQTFAPQTLSSQTLSLQTPVPQKHAPLAAASADADSEKDFFIEALTACQHNDHKAFTALAASRHLLPDALAEAINDHLYDLIGDVVLEEGEHGYHLVTEYLEEITAWMKK